jgi:hypothetical protein
MEKLYAYIKIAINWAKFLFHLFIEFISSIVAVDFFWVFFLCFVNLVILYYIFKFVKVGRTLKKDKPIVTKEFLDRVGDVDLELNHEANDLKSLNNLDEIKVNKEKAKQLEALQELLNGKFINKKQYDAKADEIKQQI